MELYKQEIRQEEGNELYNQLRDMQFVDMFLKEEDYDIVEDEEGNKIYLPPRGHPLKDDHPTIPVGYYLKIGGLLYKPIPLINYKNKSFILLISKPGREGYIIYYKEILKDTILDKIDTEINTDDVFYENISSFFKLADFLLKNSDLSKEAYFLYDFINQVGNDSERMKLFYIHIKETLRKVKNTYNLWIEQQLGKPLLWSDAQKLRIIRHFCAHQSSELSVKELEVYRNSDEFEKYNPNLKNKINFVEEDLNPIKWLTFYIENKEM